MLESGSILVIRRDNIGDLVCTTPLFRALREKFPDAWIGALVNSYNAPVLAGHPDLDAVYVYEKAKHRAAGESLLGVYFRRWKLFRELRTRRIDYALLATPAFSPRALSLARYCGARQRIGLVAPGQSSRGLDIALPLDEGAGQHECQRVFRLGSPFGITGEPPPPRIAHAPRRATEANAPRRVALHISARKPSQRWPAERFLDFAQRLSMEGRWCFRLFWSPGAEDDPRHPGDDAKAQALLRQAASLPIEACPTPTLASLIEGLADCDAMVCGDGGAMHLAAAVGLPIVCLFGRSDAARWHPWGVPYELLQAPSLEVNDISVDEVFAAFGRLIPV